ncbi:PREDICTED: discoidin, CUB and LCCL domain-containing protein 2-like [Branchiostoma belcheri]|uniref:Discoidin, CUB and LCCL domain-containing protein 2-like n=1 Tax=Branchiostoma belcheri TaxID=7741 RepID=A0A6P4ZRH3_BRABE|nr:PREDICTED: discoidin, CUB and LCCL domain-containing protein 2-like [Branchiostoma belcheri]
MVNGDIKDNHISASSEKSGYEAYMGRLNGPRAWQPTVANTNQWLQVKFNNRTIITGIQTQGLWGGHVKSYRLLYGDTEDGLSVYTETGSDSANVFDANSDGPTVVSHDLDRPFIASVVRVNPQDFTSALIRLRVEVLGCEESLESIQPGTTTPIATTALSTFKAITTEDEQPTPPPSTQSRTAEMSATTLSQTTTALPTSQPNTMFSQTTSSLSPPVLTTTQPTDATTSVPTTQPTLPPSTQSETTDFSTTSLIQILTSGLMTPTPPTIITTTTTLVTSETPPKSSPVSTAVETAETTTVATLTTTAPLTSPVLETLATTAAMTKTSIQTTTSGGSSTMEANTAPVTTPGM